MTKFLSTSLSVSLTDAGILHQWTTYRRDVGAFVRDCVWIYDATAQDWVRFELRPAQVRF